MNPTLINQKGFKSFSIKLLLSFLIFSSPLKAKDSIKWTSLVETCKDKGSEICAGNFIASASCGLTLSYVNGNSLEEANIKAHKLFTAFMNFAQIDESIIFNDEGKLKKQVEHQALHAFKQCKNIDQFVKKAYEENQKKEISPELQIGLEKALPISLINSFAIMRKKEM